MSEFRIEEVQAQLDRFRRQSDYLKFKITEIQLEQEEIKKRYVEYTGILEVLRERLKANHA